MQEIITVKLYRTFPSSPQKDRDILIWYTIKGSAVLTVQESEYHLDTGEFALVNYQEEYTLQIQRGLLACLRIDAESLLRMLHYEPRYFVCASKGSEDPQIQKIRRLIGGILTAPYLEDLNEIALRQDSYDLLALLLKNFTNNSYFFHGTGEENRKVEMTAWLRANSTRETTMREAAEYLGLTPQYFSRWFHQEFGTSFLKYLGRIRLEKAEELLEKTDKSILHIALECGFPNAASFSRIFKEKHGETPMEYRKSHPVELQEETLGEEEIRTLLSEEEESETNTTVMRVDLLDPGKPLEKPWNFLCNPGTVSDLSDRNIQELIRSMQKELKLRWARVIFDHDNTKGLSSFYEEDRCGSFLYDISVKPLFVIDLRRYGEDPDFFAYLKAFITHTSQRFGVQTYHFEMIGTNEFDAKSSSAYASFAKEVRRTAALAGVSCQLYGPGILLNENGRNLKEFLRYNHELDHITISSAPFTVGNRQGEVFINRITTAGYLSEQMETAQRIMQEAGLEERPILTSWRDTLDEYDVLNDSCYAAARFIHMILGIYGRTPALPLERMLDGLHGSSEEKTFSGQAGLMTPDGIRKPSFYALRFLNNLDATCQGHNEHMIVTSSGTAYHEIVIENCSILGYPYYMENRQLAPGSAIPEDFYESREPLKYSIVLENIPDGEYFIKMRTVNEEKGNAYRCWVDLNYPDTSLLGRDEETALHASAVPAMHGELVKTQNGVLKIDGVLSPNEIRHLHIIPKK
jgi:AraC-like DNA-binding protein/beta-xylosidase